MRSIATIGAAGDPDSASRPAPRADQGGAPARPAHRHAPADHGPGDRGIPPVGDAAYFRPESAPLERIFGPSAGVNLNPITCGGTLNPATCQYDQRLVVFTTLVEG